MPVIFDQDVHVYHCGFSIVSDPDQPFDGGEQSWKGQSNGLCGAGFPGLLNLRTGMDTGSVRVTIEMHDSPPPLTDVWDDVVEVPFRPVTEDVFLVEGSADEFRPLPLQPGDYRVRYCATGMDAGHDQMTTAHQPAPDRYLIQMWPAPSAPSCVVRQRSDTAASYHRTFGSS